jgi:hypothetical protein
MNPVIIFHFVINYEYLFQEWRINNVFLRKKNWIHAQKLFFPNYSQHLKSVAQKPAAIRLMMMSLFHIKP